MAVAPYPIIVTAEEKWECGFCRRPLPDIEEETREDWPHRVDGLILHESCIAPYRLSRRHIAKAERQRVAEVLAARWYEMEWLVPYHAVVGLAGFLLAVGCVCCYSWRAGLGVAGAGLMALAWLMAKA